MKNQLVISSLSDMLQDTLFLLLLYIKLCLNVYSIWSPKDNLKYNVHFPFLTDINLFSCSLAKLPGSSCGSNDFWSVFFTYQSNMRPTNGEINVTPASAQATAWKENLPQSSDEAAIRKEKWRWIIHTLRKTQNRENNGTEECIGWSSDFDIQWNPGLMICQGDVKIILLNQDIVIPRFPVFIKILWENF